VTVVLSGGAVVVLEVSAGIAVEVGGIGSQHACLVHVPSARGVHRTVPALATN
jgi:hypothetical protein